MGAAAGNGARGPFGFDPAAKVNDSSSTVNFIN